MISMPTPPLPAPPPPPANPPLFGSQMTNTAGKRQTAMAGQAQGYGSTILGQSNPTNTGQKTLLGQ
jgi:hypothetical protein